MTDKFEKFTQVAKSVGGYLLEAAFRGNGKNTGNNAALAIMAFIALVILTILLYAGAETAFLLTRKNFGGNGVKKIRAVVSFGVFMWLAYFCYSMSLDYYGEATALGSELSYWYASLTFLAIAVLTLIRSFTAPAKSILPDDHPEAWFNSYRGDSWLFSGLLKENWPQSLVQDVAEPFLFVALGLYLASFNYVWGAPIMFCGFSCWFWLGVESALGFFKERKLLSNQGRMFAEQSFSPLVAR